MLLIGGFCIVFSNEIGKFSDKKEQKKKDAWRQNLRTASLDAQFGECVKNIENYYSDISIRVYDKSCVVAVNGQVFEFKDLISCNIVDNANGATISTSADSGNMIGRAIVGGAIAGPVGAAIGGGTAKRSGEVEIVHKYVVCLYLRNLQTPSIQIDSGIHFDLANEIYGLFNAIISSSNK